MPSHTHTQNSHSHSTIVLIGCGNGVSGEDGSYVQGGNTSGATATNQNTGGGAAHENKPPYASVYFIIKT